MEPPDPSSLAKLLVEKHGKDAYARAVSSMIDRQKAGDQAAERMCLQVIVAVHLLLQAGEPLSGGLQAAPRDADLRTATRGHSFDGSPAMGDPDRTLH